jgi:hypothetical protein
MWFMDVRFEWTEATTERAIVMWNNGAGAQQIADELGTTRNSVIGKMHRTSKVRDDIKKYENPVLRGKSGNAVSKKPKASEEKATETEAVEPPKPKSKPVVVKPEPVEVVAEQVEDDDGDDDVIDLPWHPTPIIKQSEPVLERPVVNGNGVSFFDVKSCQCRWPLWGDQLEIPIEDKRFCGKRTETATSSWCSQHADRLLVR